jgi:hypothetical protein
MGQGHACPAPTRRGKSVWLAADGDPATLGERAATHGHAGVPLNTCKLLGIGSSACVPAWCRLALRSVDVLRMAEASTWSGDTWWATRGAGLGVGPVRHAGVGMSVLLPLPLQLQFPLPLPPCRLQEQHGMEVVCRLAHVDLCRGRGGWHEPHDTARSIVPAAVPAPAAVRGVSAPAACTPHQLHTGSLGRQHKRLCVSKHASPRRCVSAAA